MQTTLGDLFTGMLTVSGNDAAREVAAEVAGSEEHFAEWMNLLVKRLGLRDSHFVNPHGRDADNHYSTAHDMALLAAEAMRYQAFREVVGSARAEISIDGSPWRLRTTNAFLGSYGGATGIKTGFTAKGGPSLAASAARDGHELIVVVLNDGARFQDAGRLLSWAFNEHSWTC